MLEELYLAAWRVHGGAQPTVAGVKRPLRSAPRPRDAAVLKWPATNLPPHAPKHFLCLATVGFQPPAQKDLEKGRKGDKL